MLQTAFDTYAADYDAHFTHTPIGQMQRQRVYNYLNPLLKTPKSILELNCGTGFDAHTLARKGHCVTATDISQGMIDFAKAKQDGNNPNFKCIDLRQIHTLNLPKQDFIFSNFGGLNCISANDFKTLSQHWHTQLNTDGLVLAIIMGTRCWWENFYFKRIGHKGYQRRQNSEGVSTTINGETFTTWYYSPQQVSTFLQNHFITMQVRPIGLFVPPSYLNAYFKNKGWALKGLYALEKLFGNFSKWANYADHYSILLKRRHV